MSDSREDIYTESVEMHRKYGGKVEIRSKVPLENQHDLSLAYTPGVARVCGLVVRASIRLPIDEATGPSVSTTTGDLLRLFLRGDL